MRSTDAAIRAPSWPVVVIDFEASSLETDGYPIEVGVAVWSARDAPILGWSCLIQPTDAWSRSGSWDPDSAAIHGLRPWQLRRHGHPPAPVAKALNLAVGPGGTAWCDGGRHDAMWAWALFRAGDCAAGFHLGDWHTLLARHDPAHGERPSTRPEQPRPHRARADAEHLMLALTRLIGAAPEVGDLADRIPALAQLCPVLS